MRQAFFLVALWTVTLLSLAGRLPEWKWPRAETPDTGILELPIHWSRPSDEQMQLLRGQLLVHLNHLTNEELTQASKALRAFAERAGPTAPQASQALELDALLRQILRHRNVIPGYLRRRLVTVEVRGGLFVDRAASDPTVSAELFFHSPDAEGGWQSWTATAEDPAARPNFQWSANGNYLYTVQFRCSRPLPRQAVFRFVKAGCWPSETGRFVVRPLLFGRSESLKGDAPDVHLRPLSEDPSSPAHEDLEP